MQRVRLGRTGLVVSKVGFGGIPIQRLSEDEAVRVVKESIDMGITLIDTANGYTTSEERIGKAIKGQRQNLVIATKTGARDAKTAREHLELSLRRLQTDYIDIWQFHNASKEEHWEKILGPSGAMEVASKAVDEGKVRHIGVTTHYISMAERYVESGLVETVQAPFNFMATDAAERLVDLAREHDVGFIAMKPMAGGMLQDAKLAFRFLMQYDNAVPIPGIERIEEMREIISIVENPAPLSESEKRRMDEIREELGPTFCRRCDYCQPCPQEIPISMVLSIESFIRRMPPDRVISGGMAKGIDKAETCTECGECEERCPYELPIREMLKEKIATFREYEARYAKAV
ncbi:MAG: aldo/keto reductase [bacterium]